jgi:hypothetical protein
MLLASWMSFNEIQSLTSTSSGKSFAMSVEESLLSVFPLLKSP